jgi:S-DNA-T family DNA segregation ATPase FtsK/SpoIIIE
VGWLVVALGRLSGQIWGVILVVFGFLAALGVYGSLIGPAGRLFAAGTGDLFGSAGVLVPLGLMAVGVALVSRGERAAPGGVAGGMLVVTLGLAGLLSLVGGPPQVGAPLPRLRASGGLIGAGVAEPLRAALASWGAGIVLGVAMGVGLLILTGTSVEEAVAGGRACGRGLRRVTLGGWALLGLAIRRLTREPSSRLVPGPEPAEAMVSPPPPAVPGLPANSSSPRPPRADPLAVVEEAPAPGEQLKLDVEPAVGSWRLPPLRLLHPGRHQVVDRRLLLSRGEVLVESLAAHGVGTTLVGMTVGPTVTRYELELGAGVKVARVTSLAKDIAYAMASPDVRILAPIPGRSAIGVEVPNVQRQIVALADILASPEAQRATHPLEVAMGRDIAGRPVMVNLAEMPHLLIAGATGAGKSSCINSLVTSILMRASPEQVRLILVDPKRVELGQYNGLPHLLTQVVVNPKKAANALAWAVKEMERRYDLLAEVGVRDIGGYNRLVDSGDLGRPVPGEGEAGGADGLEAGEDRGQHQRLPYILVVVDELNDLMMVAARDVEEAICRIAQMARAVGIHLVIATQRPSVDVITGVIKANIPSRLAFSVSSLADSRVILDQPGAERLVGKGDMLLLTASSSVPRRLQGPWVTEPEVRQVVAHWRRQSQPRYVEGVEGEGPGEAGDEAGGEADDLLAEALELVVRSRLGSTSMLQRKLRVGFARAGRLMDLLERRGVVGPSEGSKARAVLMTPEELDQQQ